MGEVTNLRGSSETQRECSEVKLQLGLIQSGFAFTLAVPRPGEKGPEHAPAPLPAGILQTWTFGEAALGLPPVAALRPAGECGLTSELPGLECTYGCR